jgi:protein-tyrosine phosphatase
VGRIFDLRTDGERVSAPTVWRRPAIHPVSVGFDPKSDPSDVLQTLLAGNVEPEHATAAMQAITARIAIDGAPEIGQVLLALAHGDEPAIIHCTAGKDRTGVVSAFLQTLLGVARETIYEDYLRSNDTVAAEIARRKAMAATAPSASPVVSAMPPETIGILMSADRSYLESAFAAVGSEYGSFDAYVGEGLKLSPADVQTLRKRLLERQR